MAPLLRPRETESSLPGLKRGIAVGVAASVCIILIALLAFFVLRRRAQRKKNHLRAQTYPEHVKELPAIPLDNESENEKNYAPIPTSPIEVNAQFVYELDATEFPELPDKAHVPSVREIGEGADADVVAQNESIGNTRRLSHASSQRVNEPDSQPHARTNSRPGSQPESREVPLLNISLPNVSPIGSCEPLLSLSPLIISPLQEAYLPQAPQTPQSPRSPCSPPSPQSWTRIGRPRG